ncbi:MAG: peptidoglycan DD-metalloendopeptidase family protein [Caldimonas sp.]
MATLLILAGCVNRPHRAPVEDRVATPRAAIAVPVASASAVSSPTPSDVTPLPLPPPLPGAENAGKPGYYAVKPGDTLIRIGLDNGQNWKDLVKWNNLDNPNVIEVGQVLRVVPPGVDPSLAQARAVTTTARVESKPLGPASAASAAPSAAPTTVGAAPPAPAASAPQVSSSSPIAVAASPTREGDEEIRWGWPAAGSVVAPFDEGKVKGLVIGGKAGDPVLAAADGRVVYAGSGLRGYGNLVILKHNSTYLTAYAHNQTLLVKEDQNVKRGQKIAEMGSTDADGVQLHFEIRKQGKPIDPAKLLPSR